MKSECQTQPQKANRRFFLKQPFESNINSRRLKKLRAECSYSRPTIERKIALIKNADNNKRKFFFYNSARRLFIFTVKPIGSQKFEAQVYKAMFPKCEQNFNFIPQQQTLNLLIDILLECSIICSDIYGEQFVEN